ncbi:MAG: phosphopantetheinyl transferase [Rhodobacteraceae bacterium]|nr:MAG: phosphopantetheinyl transferase [Paracoccaceae bacterium]
MIQQKFAFPEFLRHLLPETVAMGSGDPRAPMPRLMGDEVLAIEQVSTARARAFGAGRQAAREAMAQLGLIPRPVLQGIDLAPVWPAGLTGSITHTDTACLAVVTDAPEIAALGIDLEPATALEPSLWPVVCTMPEMNWLARLGPTQRGNFAQLILCAKHAVYKAQFQISRTELDFQAVGLDIDLQASRFTARFNCALPGFAPETELPGRFAILSSAFVATVEVAR